MANSDPNQTTIPGALRHAIATMVNDDLSEPGTKKRARFVERLAAMEEAAEALEEADQIRRAFLRYIQEENGCNGRREMGGEPCREPERCGCHLEMMAQYADAE